MVETRPSRDLTRMTFAVLFLVALLATSLWILRPFFGPLLWATLLVVACWPLMRRLQVRLGNRRGRAVAVMMGLTLLVFVIPVALILGVLISRAPQAGGLVEQLVEQGLPPPPDWVGNLPLVGPRAAATWSELAAAGPGGLADALRPYAQAVAGWFVSQAGSMGLLLLHFLMTLIIATVLFARGEAFADHVRSFARRLADERGDRAVLLAAQSVRAVAFGVVVTALVQASMGGIGLVVAGVPVPGLLTAVMFITSIAQIGAVPVLALATVWLFVQDHTGWGLALAAWTVLVGSIDNVVRPLLIKRGVDLPLLLVFAGVIGGLVSFGPVGLFAGPVVLAVGHTLLTAWVRESGVGTAPGPVVP